MVDTRDSKSRDSDIMRVRVSPAAPENSPDISGLFLLYELYELYELDGLDELESAASVTRARSVATVTGPTPPGTGE